MSEPRCECCDLLISACGKQAAHRSELEAKKRSAELLNRGWFKAKFPGQCRECGEGFEAGDLIKGSAEGYGHRCRRYFAECCAEVVSGKTE